MRIQPNTLYYDDCKAILEAVAQPFADLVYLDPPFNSKRDYNVLFEGSALQQKAFVDTWKWGEVAEEGFEDIAGDAYHPANKVIPGLHHFLGDSGTMAYLVYMADRLAAIKEVMLPTASIYLHCDPTASHYLKVVMDCIFGHDNFLNEFVWWYGGGGGQGRKSGVENTIPCCITPMAHGGLSTQMRLESRINGIRGKSGLMAVLGAYQKAKYRMMCFTTMRSCLGPRNEPVGLLKSRWCCLTGSSRRPVMMAT